MQRKDELLQRLMASFLPRLIAVCSRYRSKPIHPSLLLLPVRFGAQDFAALQLRVFDLDQVRKRLRFFAQISLNRCNKNQPFPQQRSRQFQGEHFHSRSWHLHPQKSHLILQPYSKHCRELLILQKHLRRPISIPLVLRQLLGSR